MEDVPLGRIAALVPEFAVKDLPLGRTLVMKYIYLQSSSTVLYFLFIFLYCFWREYNLKEVYNESVFTQTYYFSQQPAA